MYSYGLTALSSSTGTGGAFADLCLQKSELANVRVRSVMKIQQTRLLCMDQAATLGSGHLLEQMLCSVYLDL